MDNLQFEEELKIKEKEFIKLIKEKFQELQEENISKKIIHLEDIMSYCKQMEHKYKLYIRALEVERLHQRKD